MKFLKGGNLAKLVAFFLIAAILTCTVAFASGGWQSFTEVDPDSDDTAGDGTQGGDVDENTDGNNETQLPPSVEPPPVFTHYLTGLTVTAEEAARAPLAFVYSTKDPLYAISSSIMTVEIPTENGSTRLLAFTSGSDYLGKIGSISPTRGYINAIADKLGGAVIHRGVDDSFDYGASEYDKALDLTVHGGYSYTEYTDYHYSNGDLISALLKNTGTSTVRNDTVSVPFRFADTEIKSRTSATSVVIPYSEKNVTQLIYDGERGEYVLHKGAGAVKDLLNDKTCGYKNAFVLYASSTTYETADATETIIDTEGGGFGYYFTMGSVTRISWTTDESGNLLFLDESGARLTVNRGTSYVAFEKASRINDTTYN